MAYWMHITQTGERQIKTTNGKIVFRYSPKQAEVAEEHIRRLQGTPMPKARKSDFPRNKVERKVYEHYLSGIERGDLFRYVKLGKAGLPGPERSHAAAYAAWMAGKALAE